MAGNANHWDNLPAGDAERIAALPLAEQVWALLDHAPKASASDLAVAFDNEHTISALRAIRNEWKAHRRAGTEDGPPALPTRDVLVAQLIRAANAGQATEVERWLKSITALDRAGGVDTVREDSEDWDRLEDVEAGVLIALTRKLNGVALAPGDLRWLARVR